MVVFLVSTIVTLFLALISLAPLEEAANPAVTPIPAKAPWYFLWLQELIATTTLRIGSITISGGLIGGILIPGFLVILAIVWPFLDKSPKEAIGVWFHKSRRPLCPMSFPPTRRKRILSPTRGMALAMPLPIVNAQ